MNRPNKLIIFISFLSIGLCAGSLFLPGESFSEEARPIYAINIDNYIITPAVEEYVTKSIRIASESGQALIIYLDTPGGLLNSTRNIVREMMNSRVPVVVYVAPKGARAGSAGVFITLAANVACMAPSTNIGAAHPVQIKESKNTISDLIKEIIEYLKGRRGLEGNALRSKPKGQQGVLSEKIINDTLAWVATIAENRGRNVEWAKKAVSESISATEKEALKAGIIDFIAEDTQGLLKKLNSRRVTIEGRDILLNTEGVSIREIEMTFRQRFLNIVSNPSIAYILMMLGFYGLLFEFTHPGVGFPGIAGAVAIILGFYGLHTLPTNYAGLALIVLAIILFIAETQVSSFGLLALGGITCMFLGSVILIDSPYVFMRISLKVILPLILTTAGITIFLTSAIVKAHRRKVTIGKEGLIGETAEVLEDIKSKPARQGTGKVFIHGEIWQVKSKDTIKRGEEVEVIGFDNMKLLVKKKEV